MAKVTFPTPMSNTLGDFSVYKQRGLDKIITRAKGGPSPEQIKNAPEFEKMRRHQSEFGAIGKLSGLIMKTCSGVKHLADYNFCGEFTIIGKFIAEMDNINPLGKRSILVSKNKSFFVGFDMNKNNPFDSVIKQSPEVIFSRNALKATVHFPVLSSKINFKNPWPFPLVRFAFSFGIVPDMVYADGKYSPANPAMEFVSVSDQTDWFPSDAPLSKFDFTISLDNRLVLDDSGTLMFSIGVELGKETYGSVIVPVKNAGCAKILAVG